MRLGGRGGKGLSPEAVVASREAPEINEAQIPVFSKNPGRDGWERFGTMQDTQSKGVE
jgi:hypothetical protein